MATTVARLQAILSANTKDFDRAMTKSEDRMGTVGKTMHRGALIAGAGIALGLGKAVQGAATFERSMNTLQAVSGVTGDQLDKLRQESIKLGADVHLPATSAQDAAAAMTELVKAGLSVKDTMAAARPVLVLSAAANIDNAQAAEIAANALNAFHLEGKKAAMVTDQLANVANASSVEITDVADSFKMASAVFSAFQGPVLGAEKAMTELNVAIGILGNAGIKGSDAGTSLKQALLQLTAPASKTKRLMRDLYQSMFTNADASDLMKQAMTANSKELDKIEDKLGKVTLATFKGGDIAYTAAGKMRSLNEIVGILTKATAKMTQEERNFYVSQIFGADATRSIITLMQAGPAAWDKMTAAVNKQGAAQALADAKMKGFQGTMEAARSALETLEITLGTGLLPIMTRLASMLAQVANLAAAHKRATQLLIGAVAAFSAIVLTTNVALKLHSFWLVAVKGATAAWTAVQWLLNAALSASPATRIALALTALGAALIYAYKHNEEFRSSINKANADLQAFHDWLVKFKGPSGLDIVNDLSDAFKSAAVWVSKMQKSFRSFLDDLKSLKGPSGIDLIRKIGDSHDPSFVPPSYTFKGGLHGALPVMRPFAASGAHYGLHITAGKDDHAKYTKHGTISDHWYGKALDMADGPASMAAFFRSLVGNPKVKQAFYDPLGSIFGGAWSSYREGGHSDHVHVATYDQGGFLQPGWNLAYNGTGRPERVVRNATHGNIVFNFHGPVLGKEQQIVQLFRNAVRTYERNNGRTAFGF